MQYRYPQPGDEDLFEEFCLRLYRLHLKRANLVLYAKRGESQDGVDIIDQLATRPVTVIQCKFHEPHKTITPQEIKAEVKKAEGSPHEIEHYIIATTAKKSKNAQNTIIQLNKRGKGQRPFTVEIHFWEELTSILCEFGRAIADFVISGEMSQERLLEPLAASLKSTATSASAESSAPRDSSYPEIERLFAERRIDAAEHEIERLPDTHTDDSLDLDQRYAILRLRGKLALEQLKYNEAVDKFTEAYNLKPTLPQAQQNYVLALTLDGKNDIATTEARKLIAEGQGSGFLVSLLVRAVKSTEELDSLKDILKKYESTSEEVNLALVEAGLSWGQFDLAKTAAEKALGISPKSPHAHFAIGRVEHELAAKGPVAESQDHAKSAISAYTNAISEAKQQHYVALLPEVLTNRSRVYAMRENIADAARDVRDAVASSSEESMYTDDAVRFFLHFEDYESAWEFVPFLDASKEEPLFLKIATEFHHAPRDEKESFIDEMRKLAHREGELESAATYHCVQWAIELGNYSLARECISESFNERHPFEAMTLKSWIELAAGDRTEATSLAGKALDASSKGADEQVIRALSRILLQLNDDVSALPFLELIYSPGVLDDDCKALIYCAQRLSRHDLLIRICEELSESGLHDNKTRRLQVELLSNYAPERAFQLAQEYRQHDQTLFQVFANYLAGQLGKPELIELDAKNPLSPADFQVNEVGLVVVPYIATNQHFEALRFLYGMLRRNFSNPDLHAGYMHLVLRYGSKLSLDAPESVGSHCAVRLLSELTKHERWLIIEDDSPQITLNEIASGSEVAQLLQGKKCNETVELRQSAVQANPERIIELQSPYLRRFQDCIEHFQERFPDQSVIQSMHVGSGDSFDPAPIIEQLRQSRDNADEAFRFYHENLCPIHFLAHRLSKDNRDVQIGLSANDEWFVRCSNLDAVEFERKAGAAHTGSTIVLDISAITTIDQLGLWGSLDSQYEFLVARSAVAEIDAIVHATCESDMRPSAYSYLTDSGQPGIRKVSDTEWENEKVALQSLKANMDRYLTPSDSLVAAQLEPKRRDDYREVCGGEALDAICIASEKEAMLWTDDLFIAVIAEIDFGVERTWTQLQFRRFTLAGVVSTALYDELSAKLAAWNYVNTIINVEQIVVAGALTDWDVSKWPFKQCLAQLGNNAMSLQNKTIQTIRFFRRLRQSNCIELKQSAVIRAALDALDSTLAARLLAQRVDLIFPIDFFSAQFLRQEIEFWLALRLP